MYQETHTGNDKQEDGRQLVNLESKRYFEAAGSNKIEIGHYLAMPRFYFKKQNNTNDKRDQYYPAPDYSGKGFGKAFSSQPIDKKADQWKKRDQVN
jgi:hypothetical protein